MINKTKHSNQMKLMRVSIENQGILKRYCDKDMSYNDALTLILKNVVTKGVLKHKIVQETILR
jgi:hypothetical protein